MKTIAKFFRTAVMMIAVVLLIPGCGEREEAVEETPEIKPLRGTVEQLDKGTDDKAAEVEDVASDLAEKAREQIEKEIEKEKDEATEWYSKHGATLEKEVNVSMKVMGDLTERYDEVISGSDEEFEQWFEKNASALATNAEAANERLAGFNEEFQRAAAGGEKQLIRWLDERAEGIMSEAEVLEPGLTGFRDQMSATAENATAKANDYIANQATEIGDSLGGIIGSFDTMNRQLAAAIEWAEQNREKFGLDEESEDEGEGGTDD